MLRSALRMTISIVTLFFLSVLIIAAVAAITACTPIVETKYSTVELYRPQRPVLPRVKSSDLQCLSKEVYQNLYDRQRLITDYAVTLETIIDSSKVHK